MPDIFGEDHSPAVRAEDLVGEGKKFKTVDDLARGKAEADAFIERLKSEKAEAERKATEAVNAEASLAELREELAALKQASQTGERQVQPPKPENIQAIVAEEITRAEQRRTQAQNVAEANRLMVEQFGDLEKAGIEVAKRGRELGLTPVELKEIASRSPNAFKRMMGGDVAKPVDVDLTRSTTQPAITPKALSSTVGTKEFYQEMLRKDPRRYTDPRTQAEILKHTLDGTYIP